MGKYREFDMGLFLRILSFAALAVCVLSTVMAGSLYWDFNFGDCKNGCAEGMAYALFLPAVLVAVTSGVIGIGSHFMGKRARSG